MVLKPPLMPSTRYRGKCCQGGKKGCYTLNAENTLSIFYAKFLRVSGGDEKGLNAVITQRCRDMRVL